MSEQWQITIIGLFVTIVTLFGGIICSVLWYMFRSLIKRVDHMEQKYQDDRVLLESRQTITEQRQISIRESLDHLAAVTEKRFVLIGTKALHSPDNHLDADPELERFATLYVQHSHDMPTMEGSDWKYWRIFFFKMSMNENATPNERLLARSFKELCEHKLFKYGLLSEILKQEQKQ